MAQNQMLEYAGGTPQLALTGQHPIGLTPDSDTLAQITGALESRPDYIESMYRTRLLAKQATIQALIQERLAKAATMKQHIHQPQTLLPGTVCDIWRQPDRKDEDGWRGPAEIISIERQAGSAIVKHQGQPLIVPLHHIRKHVLQGYFHKLALDSPQQLQQAFDFCNFECIAGFSEIMHLERHEGILMDELYARRHYTSTSTAHGHCRWIHANPDTLVRHHMERTLLPLQSRPNDRRELRASQTFLRNLPR